MLIQNHRECLLRLRLLLVALNCYNNSLVIAQTTIQPLIVQVFAGEKAVFECNNTDIKTTDHIWNWYKFHAHGAQILWQEYSNNMKGRYEVLVDEQREHSRLTILNTTLEDNQTQYFCECFYASTKVTLSIVLKKSLNSMYPKCEANITAVRITKTVKMKCRAVGGDPRPSLQWYRNGEILKEQDDFVYFGDSDASYFDELTRELTVDDETAIYTCKAEGLAVERDQSCSISVAIPPTVTIIATTTYFNAGDSLEFSCMAVSLWNITGYMWMFDNHLVTSSNSSTLIVLKLQPEDGGKKIGCMAMTSSGLNGNDSVIISFLKEDKENSELKLIPIVFGGVSALTLVCITVFLIIRQKRKRNRTNAVVLLKKNIVHCVPLDSPNLCIFKNTAESFDNGNCTPQNPELCHHHIESFDVNAEQMDALGERASIGYGAYVNTATLDNSDNGDDLNHFDPPHISHIYNHTECDDNLVFDGMYTLPFTDTQEPNARSDDRRTDILDTIYATPIKRRQNQDTRSVDGIVGFGDLYGNIKHRISIHQSLEDIAGTLGFYDMDGHQFAETKKPDAKSNYEPNDNVDIYATPIKRTQKADTRSVDGIVDFGDNAKPIKHRISIHQSLEDIAGNLGFYDMDAHPFAGTKKPDAKPNDEPNDNVDIHATPIKRTQNADTRSVDGLVDFGDHAKPIKHRISIHQSIEDIVGTLHDLSYNRSGSIDHLYSKPNKYRPSAQPEQLTELYAQPNKQTKKKFKSSSLTCNTTSNMDINNSLPHVILNDQEDLYSSIA